VGNVPAYPGKARKRSHWCQQTGDYSLYNEINGLHKVTIKNPVWLSLFFKRSTGAAVAWHCHCHCPFAFFFMPRRYSSCRGITLCSAALSFAPRLGNSAFLCRSSFWWFARRAAAFFFKSRGLFLCRGIGMCCAVALLTVLRIVPRHCRLRSMAWRLRFASCRGVFLWVAAFS